MATICREEPRGSVCYEEKDLPAVAAADAKRLKDDEVSAKRTDIEQAFVLNVASATAVSALTIDVATPAQMLMFSSASGGSTTGVVVAGGTAATFGWGAVAAGSVIVVGGEIYYAYTDPAALTTLPWVFVN